MWEVCPQPATKKDLEDSLKKTEENMLASLRVLEKKIENICDDRWYTTPAPPITGISDEDVSKYTLAFTSSEKFSVLFPIFLVLHHPQIS